MVISKESGDKEVSFISTKTPIGVGWSLLIGRSFAPDKIEKA